VYPSPADAYVVVDIPEQQKGDLYILDMKGHIVIREEEVMEKQRVDISFLSSGIYSVEFVPCSNMEKVVYTKRIVVK